MARERYLLNTDEDTIHSNVIAVQTNKDKRKNWWYYNKVKLLVGVLVAATVVYFVWTVFFGVKPDYTIALVNKMSLDQSVLTLMGDQIAEYGEDLNGDGQVVVNLVNYSIDAGMEEDSYYAQTMQAFYVKFAGDMGSGDSMIWLHDPEGYHQISADMEGVFEQIDAEGTTGGGTMLAVTEIPGLNDIDYSGYTDGMMLSAENVKELNSALRLSIRKTEDSNIEKNKDLIEYHDACERLFENLLSGAKTATPAEE